MHDDMMSTNAHYEYPVDLSEIFARIKNGEYGPLDQAGLPLVDYERLFAANRIKSKTPIGAHYTPVTLAFFALGNLQSDLVAVRRVAEWFVAHQIDSRGTGGVWLHRFPMPHLPPLIEYLPGAWISAMAQGLGASVLLRASAIFNAPHFFAAARGALDCFRYSTSRGGVAHELNAGNIFLEEFPADPPMHVLNGALFALIGLHEFLQHERFEEFERTYRRALQGVLQLLPRFDAGYASYYDLRGRQIANASYHDLHIRLLHAMANLSGEAEFQRTAARWQEYTMHHIKRALWWCADKRWALCRRLMRFDGRVRQRVENHL